jgi:hypothetical protein
MEVAVTTYGTRGGFFLKKNFRVLSVILKENKKKQNVAPKELRKTSELVHK